MTDFYGDREFDHASSEKIGVLLCNLGTPEYPTAKSVRKYLAEFLSDPRVVELPRSVWLPILHGIVLRLRPRRSAKAYAEIWTPDGSPLMAISTRLSRALQTSIDNILPERVEIALAMRYGTPSIAQGLQPLRAANARNILVLPLYPQYAGATTGSLIDAISKELTTWRWVPSLRFINSYHANQNYIDALARSVTNFRAEHGASDHLLMSFHGTPKDSLLRGDPYHCECQVTARLLAEGLGMGSEEWTLAFQSRFGWNEWLQPYTEASLRSLAQQGAKVVDVICPGFPVDCLETLEEIAIRYAKAFKAAGGESLRYIPALNDGADHADTMIQLILSNISGWELANPLWDAKNEQLKRSEMAERAAAMQATF